MEVDRIAEVFRDECVFLTGATGFMGKVFLERILRVTDVKKIFILIRPKKDKKPQDRLNELLNIPLFDKLKEKLTNSQINSKLYAISGDCGFENLNLSSVDRDFITKHTTMIFHFAATVKFTEKLKRAIEINLRGTRDMINLANECEKLKIFCHVSTAYCHFEQSGLMEKFYEPPADVHEMIKIAENYNVDEVEEMLSGYLCGEMANSYVFTKALSEGLIDEAIKNFKLPILIIRPPIVIAMYCNPLPGWTDSLSNVSGLIAATGTGLMRVCRVTRSPQVNVVPVDHATSNIMASTWNYLTKGTHSIVNLDYLPHKYVDNWSEVLEASRNCFPFNMVLWYPSTIFISSHTIYLVISMIFHWLPAIIVDGVMRLMGREAVLFNAHKRLAKELKVILAFADTKWSFDTTNIHQIYELMNDKEASDYGKMNFIPSFFLKNLALGIRRYVFKQNDESLVNARKRMEILKLLDKVFKGLLLCVLAYFLYKIFKSMT